MNAKDFLTLAALHEPRLASVIGTDREVEVASLVASLLFAATGQYAAEEGLKALAKDSEMSAKFKELLEGMYSTGAPAADGVGYVAQLQEVEGVALGDSWLSKNVRPACVLLLALTLCIAFFVPSITPERLEVLRDLAYAVFGYYFLGRSMFDKGALSLRWPKKQ